jgi:hypothetical protein
MDKKGLTICVLLTTLISLFCGCNDLNLGEVTQFSITSFNVKPSVITVGETANLSWIVLSAQTVSIDNGIGNVSNTGNRIIMPTETTTYFLTAVNGTKILTASTQIIVKESSNDNDSSEDLQNDSENIFLSVYHQNIEYNFTLSQLENIDVYTASGRYIKTKLLPDSIVLSDTQDFSGVRIQKLINEINPSINNFNLTVTSLDGWTTEFSKDEVIGNVDIYDESGTVISSESATMILAFKEDGEYYSDIDSDSEIGPLRVAFVSNSNPITSSSLWSKMVVSITITDLEDSDDSKEAINDNPIATIDTSKGTIKIELYVDEMPKTCENFIALANDGFYDGMIFHRVMDDFMIQAGNTFPVKPLILAMRMVLFQWLVLAGLLVEVTNFLFVMALNPVLMADTLFLVKQ